MTLVEKVSIEPIFLSISATAETLATSPSEIYQRLARGELTAVKDGSRTKVTYESVKRLADPRVVQAMRARRSVRHASAIAGTADRTAARRRPRPSPRPP